MPLPKTRLLTLAVRELLDAHTTLTAYTSVVDPAPETDEHGVTMGYAVLHPFPGDATTNNLAGVPGQLLWQFQITCGGGDTNYVMWVVDTVRSLLDGKTLTVAGTKVGLMRPPLGYNPPAPNPQPLESGQRLQVPLLYQLIAAA